jgi:hypothetical protein
MTIGVVSDTLYIIGNGFDRHHRIPSSFAHFAEYLKNHDRSTYGFVERYFYVDDEFWSDFEESLASFDSATLIEDASDFLKSYATEKWKEEYHHDYQFEIEQAVEAISVRLRSRFAEWVRQLRIPTPSEIADVRVPLDTSAVFLNFNYTPTLQRVYHVPDAHILHIQGKAAQPNDQLVLGHGWEPKANPESNRVAEDQEWADTRVIEGQQIIDKYFRDTFKPTARIIQNIRRPLKDQEDFRDGTFAVLR